MDDIYRYSDAGAVLRAWYGREKRGGRGLTIRKLARRLRKSPGFMCRVMNGDRPVPPALVERIISLTGLCGVKGAAKGPARGAREYFRALLYLQSARIPLRVRAGIIKRFRRDLMAELARRAKRA